MLRLFYTSEKTDNRIFQHILWFQPSDWWLLIDDISSHGWIFLDGRYIEKEVKEGEYIIEKVLADKKINEHLKQFIPEDEIVFLETSIPHSVYEVLNTPNKKHNVLFSFEENSRQVSKRVIKNSDQELKIKQAIHITEQLWQSILDLWDDIIWMTELEVRWMLTQMAFSLWAEAEAFDTIVATGKNSCIPHHTSWVTNIWAGPLLIDMWRRVEWWCSDFTRTIRVWDNEVGKEKFTNVLNIVKKAHDVAMSMIKPWVSFKEIAKAARECIDKAWYGEFYTHSLWHGVWLDIHEAPKVSIKSEDIIEKGMVFTIEPWVYIPGEFWVRWENIVII